jgi:AcrR family transcriptional regulator
MAITTTTTMKALTQRGIGCGLGRVIWGNSWTCVWKSALAQKGQVVEVENTADDGQMMEVVHEKREGTRIDRRALRTRERLKNGLVGLMQRKPYSDISVEEICSETGVGRSTFYLHFAGKDDLKRRGFEEHLRLQLAAHIAQPGDAGAAFAFSLAILRHARDGLPLYRQLLGGPGELLGFRAIEAVVRGAIAADLKARGCSSSAELVSFLTGAFMAMLRAWLESGATPAAEIVDAGYRRLASGAVNAT